MGVSIAEYLGQRTDIDVPNITPCTSVEECPFMDRKCDKLNKNGAPVCSVRKADGTIWIVCEHRLCATRRKRKSPDPTNPNREIDVAIGLTDHQTNILWEVAQTIYRGDIAKAEIVVKRETNIPIPSARKNSYHADFIMRNTKGGAKIDEILLEMQGGGETTNTGKISSLIKLWKERAAPTNEFLRQSTGANTLETNAWRRQQEQFLVKGSVINQTGGRIVFAVGTLLYDYILNKFDQDAKFKDLKEHNWTLCIMAFKEDSSQPAQPGPIPLMLDVNKQLFTNYSTFVRLLTDQGGPSPEIFEEDFLSLTGETVSL